MAGIGFENAPHYKAYPGNFIDVRLVSLQFVTLTQTQAMVQTQCLTLQTSV